MVKSCTILYIPIWFYSNGRTQAERVARQSFTFQSGSIQMLCIKLIKDELNLLYIPIWFYSNCIIIVHCPHSCRLYIPIWFYSNRDFQCYYLCVASFTFQSGSIQIFTSFTTFCGYKFFTFQSGSIQIGSSGHKNDKTDSLYIPIWFYSNRG